MDATLEVVAVVMEYVGDEQERGPGIKYEIDGRAEGQEMLRCTEESGVRWKVKLRLPGKTQEGQSMRFEFKGPSIAHMWDA
jgi:hypothetical protein